MFERVLNTPLKLITQFSLSLVSHQVLQISLLFKVSLNLIQISLTTCFENLSRMLHPRWLHVRLKLYRISHDFSIILKYEKMGVGGCLPDEDPEKSKHRKTETEFYQTKKIGRKYTLI